MPQTVYGRKHGGKSRFVIVAPHGAGDDLKTGIIASWLARSLSGAVVINNQYKKRHNKSIEPGSKLTGDFNRLRLAKISQKYLWRRKRKAMKIFYDDIAEYCDRIKDKHNQKAVAIYIHGMKNENVGIDLSVGLRHQGSRLFGSKYHAETGDNTGAITLKINQAKEILTQALKLVF